MVQMMTGYICSPPIYEYKGVTFEFGMSSGPWPIRKDGELFKRVGPKFWDLFEAWHAEPDPEIYRIGGGCQRI